MIRVTIKLDPIVEELVRHFAASGATRRFRTPKHALSFKRSAAALREADRWAAYRNTVPYTPFREVQR